jgi:protein-disulfide isomerase
MNNKETNKNSSGLPVLIIAGVLLAAVVGGWWFYTTSKSNPNNSKVNTPSNINKPTNQPAPTPQSITSNLPGAQPPHFKGAQNAPIVIEEFFDFQCPTCASVHPILHEINATYGSRVKVITRHFPLTQIHQNAYDAAVASEAAGLQGKFWDMQNLMFQNQQRWATAPNARALFESYAGTLGLDTEKFKEDMSGMAAKQRVDADIQRGRSMGISGTPTFYINGKPVSPDMMTSAGFKQLVEIEIRSAPVGQNQTAPAATAKPADNTAANASNSKPANK